MQNFSFAGAVPLFIVGVLVGCGSPQPASEEAAAAPQKLAAPAPDNADKCNPGKHIRVGDKVVVRLAGKALRWDTSGSFVTLAPLDAPGSGKEVELVVSTSPEGPSKPFGECLRSGNYVRLASTKHTAPGRFLQAYRAADRDHVTIGDYPDPGAIDAIFYVRKDEGALGGVIERGDVVTIRGISRDPYLIVPAAPAAGDPVGLMDPPNDTTPPPEAARWTFGNKGDAE